MASDIANRLRHELAVMLERPVSEIGISMSFAQLGVDSGHSTHLLLALEDWLKIELDAEIALEMETIWELAQYAARLRASGA